MKKIRDSLISGAGIFLGVALLALITDYSGYPLLISSFGSTCLVLFALPASPISRTKCVVMGHTISSGVGVLFLYLFGSAAASHWALVALACALGVILMLVTDTLHPPAGGNPIVIMLFVQPDWQFIFVPTMLGAIILVIVAHAYNHLLGR